MHRRFPRHPRGYRQPKVGVALARHPPRWWWPIALVSVVGALVLGTGVAHGGFTASVVNANGTVQSGDLLTAATQSSTSVCNLGTAAYSPITAANSATCGGTLAPSGTLPTTGTASQSTTVSDPGSLTPSSTALSSATCGAVSLANSIRTTNPMLVRGTTLSYAQSGPLTNATALGLSGGSTGTGYAAGVTSTTYSLLSTESEVIWFKTTSQGNLIGFTNSSATNNLTNADRMIWVDASGKVVFGVATSVGLSEVTSAAAYNNGSWHLAVGTLTTTGMSLTVDGVTASSTLTVAANAYTGYWHVGWDSEATSGFSDAPTTPYFSGTLSDAAILPALTMAQTTGLYAATSQAGWNSALNADGAVDAWQLGDDGSTAYTGAIPNVTPNLCGFADVTVATISGSSTRCAAPSSSSACGAPSSSLTLASLAATTTLPANPSPGQSLALVITLARDATTTTAANPSATGLHITDTLAVITSNGAFSATLLWPSENVIL
jgi:hypothetical protein